MLAKGAIVIPRYVFKDHRAALGTYVGRHRAHVEFYHPPKDRIIIRFLPWARGKLGMLKSLAVKISPRRALAGAVWKIS
jgi:hypothetical protein